MRTAALAMKGNESRPAGGYVFSWICVLGANPSLTRE